VAYSQAFEQFTAAVEAPILSISALRRRPVFHRAALVYSADGGYLLSMRE
jgi:hypothetical protein